jgi:hypothetical protein
MSAYKVSFCTNISAFYQKYSYQLVVNGFTVLIVSLTGRGGVVGRRRYRGSSSPLIARDALGQRRSDQARWQACRAFPTAVDGSIHLVARLMPTLQMVLVRRAAVLIRWQMVRRQVVVGECGAGKVGDGVRGEHGAGEAGDCVRGERGAGEYRGFIYGLLLE